MNYIWIILFVVSFVVALFKLIVLGDVEVFPAIINGTFESTGSAVKLALGLIGALTLWLGLARISEKSGMIQLLAKLIAPLFSRIFPDIPKNHPVAGHIMMNFSANMLGLDNAATPLGLKAMKDLQELNPDKEKASNAQIMFLTLNASGLTIVPVSIMAVRASSGAANPADVFIPILLATFCSTLAGLAAVSVYQKLKVGLYIIPLTIALVIGAKFMVDYTSSMDQNKINVWSSNISSIILFSVIVLFILYGMAKKINVYDTFIEGAKEGFETSIKIIPYVVGILVAVTMFINCGAMNILMKGLESLLLTFGWNADFIPALPTALMKPLSGSGSRAMMIATINNYGVDSFPARLSSVFQGAADTTFYILTVYFGYVGVKNSRYALTTCLIADFVGVAAAILIAYLFFH
ncbi:MAG TPA: nucleoside recognition domain-containing protein [Cytophagaceae bacterium]|nr:nucleoside recognition domain-containing protein [Cytophagaceae bacterium]